MRAPQESPREPSGGEGADQRRTPPHSPGERGRQGAHFTGGNVCCSVASSQGCPGCSKASQLSARPHWESTEGPPGTPTSPSVQCTPELPEGGSALPYPTAHTEHPPAGPHPPTAICAGTERCRLEHGTEGPQRKLREGRGRAAKAPPALPGKKSPLLPGSDRQRACCPPASPGHQRRARARRHGRPIRQKAQELKSLLHGQVHRLSQRLLWAGKRKSEVVIENLPAAPSGLRRIRGEPPKSPGAKSSQPHRRCRAQGEGRAGSAGRARGQLTAPRALPAPTPQRHPRDERSAEHGGSCCAPRERTGLGSAGAPRLRAEPGPGRAGSTACRAARAEGSRPELSPASCSIARVPRSLPAPPPSAAGAERRATPQHTDLPPLLLKLLLTAGPFRRSRPRRHTDIFFARFKALSHPTELLLSPPALNPQPRLRDFQPAPAPASAAGMDYGTSAQQQR